MLQITAAVTIIRSNSFSSEQKNISPAVINYSLGCCGEEAHVLHEIAHTLGKLLAERDALGSMALVDAKEMLQFSGYFSALVGGLGQCIAEIKGNVKVLKQN